MIEQIGPATVGMVRRELRERGIECRGSSLPATLHWLAQARLIQRRGTRRYYVYERREDDQGWTLEMAISKWVR